MRILGHQKLVRDRASVTLIRTATLMALAGCSSADRATGPSLEQGQSSPVTRELKGRCETDVTILSIAPDGRLELRDEYTCEISHLGLTHNTTLQSVIPTGAPSGGLLPATVINTGAFVSANGDRINSSFTGTGVTNLADFSTSFEGTETFLGGTGRFAGASGTAHVEGTAVLDPTTGKGKGQFTITGSTTY